jgi:hypothetical protein
MGSEKFKETQMALMLLSGNEYERQAVLKISRLVELPRVLVPRVSLALYNFHIYIQIQSNFK